MQPPPHSLLLLPLLLLFLLPTATAAAASSTQTKKLTYTLLHSFGPTDPFHARGSIDVLVDSGALTLVPPAEDQPTLLPAAAAALADTITQEMKQADGGLYRLQAVLQGGKDKAGGGVMTSVRLCDVVRAGFRENVTFTLDAEGRLLGLDYTPRMSRLSPTNCLAMKTPWEQVKGKKKREGEVGGG